MIVLLELIDSAETQKKIQLRSGQRATIGSTQDADFCLASDAQLAAQHFVIDCTAQRCILRSINSLRTFVNGKSVSEAVLNSGDVIQAGATKFSVTVEGLIEEESQLSSAEFKEQPEAKKQSSPAEVWTFLELSPELLAVVDSQKSVETLIQNRVDEADCLPALRLRGHQLGNRACLWWACSSIRKLTGANQLAEPQQAALDATENWVREQSEQSREKAKAAAEKVEIDGPGGLVAWATFCSGGNVGHPDADSVEPDSRLCGQLVAGALLQLIFEDSPSSEGKFQQVMALGKEIQEGHEKLPHSERKANAV